MKQNLLVVDAGVDIVELAFDDAGYTFGVVPKNNQFFFYK